MKHSPNDNRKFRERSFGRQVALQMIFQEEMNPGASAEFSDDFIHTELGRLSVQVTPTTPESAQELEAIREQLVNEDVDCGAPISHEAYQNLVAFVWRLVRGTLSQREEIDALITEASRNWTLERMSSTDRNVIRLAVFEMKYVGTPRPVVIHEALELGQKFGTDHSAAFINGVLDTIGKKLAAKPKSEA